MKIEFRNFMKFVILIFLGLFFTYLFISFISNNINLETNATEKHRQGLGFTIDIIWNNTKHFLQYFILFVFSPILIVLDIFNIAINYYISIQIRGIKETLLLSYKHGIIEILNICLYMYLSILSLKILIIKKRIKCLLQFGNENKYFYLFSVLVLILAAIIEGNFY